MKKNINIEDYNSCQEGYRVAEELIGVLENVDDSISTEMVEEWLKNNSKSKSVLENIASEEKLKDICKTFDREERESEILRFYASINKNHKKKVSIKRIVAASTSVAAAVAMLLFVVWQDRTSLPTVENLAEVEPRNAPANINVPTLILNSGEIIVLDTKNRVVRGNESGVVIAENGTTQPLSDTIVYNTLIVPRKFTLETFLEDGTRIFVNSDSELKIPAKFIGDKREVILLKGEAYFDVAKSDKPFVVNVSNMNVNVYGTKFNVNAYSEDIKTVLVEGSVGVTVDGVKAETRMIPNQIVFFNKTNKSIKKLDVNAQMSISWMSGFLRFEDEPMESFLKAVSRTYDVEFDLQNNMSKNELINVSLHKSTPISEVIKSIEDIAIVKIIKSKNGIYMVK